MFYSNYFVVLGDYKYIGSIQPIAFRCVDFKFTAIWRTPVWRWWLARCMLSDESRVRVRVRTSGVFIFLYFFFDDGDSGQNSVMWSK